MMQNTVPQLCNYAANAYNAKYGDFLSKPVFSLTYKNGTKIDWGKPDDKRDIPDQISVSTATYSSVEESSLLIEKESDYDETFSASVDAKFSGVTYSASASSSLLYHGSLFSSESSYYALNFYLQIILKFERIILKKTSLDKNFIAAITELPEDISSSEKKYEYYQFFNGYGTHYASFAEMGGMIVMETEIEDSLVESSSLSDVKQAISVGYNGIVNSGSLDVSAAYSSSSFLSKHKNSVRIQLDNIGGLFDKEKNISSWFPSLYNTPSLLLGVPTKQRRRQTKLEPISKLVSIAGGSSAIKTNIEMLLSTYMMQDDYNDGLLISPKHIDFNYVYDTTVGDGFIISTIQKTMNGSRGYIQVFDSIDEDPNTIRASASQHYITRSNTYIPYATLTMPKPNGTYFTSKETQTSARPSASLLFVGFCDIGEEGLLPWEKIDLDTDITAATDGFAVGYVDWNDRDGSRGYVQGKQKQKGKYTTIAGSSQHYWTRNDTIVPTNSFCMPVRKDTHYRVDFVPTSGNPIAKAFFAPMSKALVFSKAFEDRTEGRVYRAKTDGFLIAYLYKKKNGDRGYVDLYSHSDEDKLIQLGKMASTSIHYVTHGDTWVPYNTAMIPVSKNKTYTVNFKITSGNPGIRILWMPLESNHVV